MASSPRGTKSQTVVPAAQKAAAQFAQMLTAIPPIDTEGLADDILLSILNADTLDALNASGTYPTDDLDQKILEIESIERGESTIDGGLGWYLLVHAVLIESGEAITFSTGSRTICAQLVKAFTMGELPARVVFERAKTPTAAGFYPQQLRFVKRPA